MPTSGCIALRTCIVGIACSSIACAVDGNAVGSKSLSTLSVTAGKSAPHCMREFYGYDSAVYFSYDGDFTCTSTSTCQDKWWNIDMTGRVSPKVMTVCFDIQTSNFGKFSNVSFYTKENTGIWIEKCVVQGSNISSSFSHTLIDYNDTLCARIKAYGTTTNSCSILTLQNPPAVYTTGSGTISRCGTYSCLVITCPT